MYFQIYIFNLVSKRFFLVYNFISKKTEQTENNVIVQSETTNFLRRR